MTAILIMAPDPRDLASLLPCEAAGGGSIHGDRRGIALIIVVGMLAILMLLGVAFSIFTRTERTAAGNYKNDVRVRYLLQGAVARALADVDSYMTNYNLTYPDWSNGVFVSNQTTNEPCPNLFAGAVSNFLPDSLCAAIPSAKPCWQSSPVGNGRYAYAVFNCSGLLDANYAGGASNRLAGTNWNEIQLAAMPGIDTPLKAALFVNDRDTRIRRYETLEELGLMTNVWDCATFSRFPRGSEVYIGGDWSNLVPRKADIVATFQRCGFTLGEANTLFTNLIDYVDSDRIPGNLGQPATAGRTDGPFVEAVPMINELMVTNRIRFVPAGIVTNVDPVSYVSIAIEYFVPMTNPVWTALTSPFKLGYSFWFTNASDPKYLPLKNPIVGTAGVDCAATYGAPIRPPPTLVVGGSVPWPPPPISFSVVASAWVTWSNIVVDAVTNRPILLPLTVPSVPWPPPLNTWMGVCAGKAAIDPRLNWDGQDVAQWIAYNPPVLPESLGAENGITRQYLTVLPNWQYLDGDTAMYVADRPLRSAGELGYLFYGSRWQTVRLLRHVGGGVPKEVHPVVDYFTTESTNVTVFKGRLHPKSRNTNAWMCAYMNMPIDFPHGAGANRLTGTQLVNVVNSILATNGLSSFANISDLGRISFPGSTELDRESYVRNVAGLLHTNQNLFVVVAAAEATDETIVGETWEKIITVLSAERAVAEIWRDPRGDGNGNPRNFVRYFKLIEE